MTARNTGTSVLGRVLHRHPRSAGDDVGELIDRVRLHEFTTSLFFAGRRPRVYRRIVDLSGAGTGDRVLDVGCSGGYLARLLAAAVGPDGRVTGIDPSVPAIAYARRRGPANCSFEVGVAQELALPDAAFDVVTSTLAVHHIPESQRPGAVVEMCRVLRPGGRLLLVDLRPIGHHGPRRFTTGRVVERLEDVVATAGIEVDAVGELPHLPRLATSGPSGRRPDRSPSGSCGTRRRRPSSASASEGDVVEGDVDRHVARHRAPRRG